jgi:aspartate aminotransferase-like enzyme
MPMPVANALLDVPPFPTDRFAPLADRLKRLLATRSDLIFIQAEAVLALEAVASSIARPGLTIVNIVTSPYGMVFGRWLRRGGAVVVDVAAAPGRPIAMAAVQAAADALPQIDILAVVHGETSNGVLNPLAEIAALARSRNALCVVDAVASVGGHPLDADALGLDITVIGAQKALAGPPGVSAVAVSERAWAHISETPCSSPSSLSLAEIKAAWLDRGRAALPGTPPPLEFWALEAAIDRVEAEGIENLIARHRLAASASRAGLRALGIEPWIADDQAASALVTAAPVPVGIDDQALIAGAARFGIELGRGVGDIAGRLVRLNHTGAGAAFNAVLPTVVAYGAALEAFGVKTDIGAAAAAVAAVYADGASPEASAEGRTRHGHL